MVDSSERRVIASLAQLVQSISFTPRGSEVRILQGAHMVDIAQLVEHRFVVPSVVGSIPIIHPTRSCTQVV